jgi:hypothetical protein
MKVTYRHVLPTQLNIKLMALCCSMSQCYVSFHGWIIKKNQHVVVVVVGPGPTSLMWRWKKYTQRQLFHAAFALGVSLDHFLSLSFPLQSRCGGCGWFFFIFQLMDVLFHSYCSTSKLQTSTYIFKFYLLDDFVIIELWRRIFFHLVFLGSWLMLIWEVLCQDLCTMLNSVVWRFKYTVLVHKCGRLWWFSLHLETCMWYLVVWGYYICMSQEILFGMI